MTGSETLIVAIGVVATPIIIVLAFFASKVLWAFFPFMACMAASLYLLYQWGIDYFFLIAFGIMTGIVATWLWQRTGFYLAGERFIEKITFTGD